MNLQVFLQNFRYDPVSGLIERLYRGAWVPAVCICKTKGPKVNLGIANLAGRKLAISALRAAWILYNKKLPEEGFYVYAKDWDNSNTKVDNLVYMQPTDRGSKSLGIEITYERAVEVFNYDEDTGKLRWKIRVGNSRAGRVISTKMSDGYLCVRLDGITYLQHRIIWLLMTGSFPEEPLVIDHKNRIKTDNRWDNLRLVTVSENTHNQVALLSTNTSGFAGVKKYIDGKRWIAYMYQDNTYKYIGLFDSPEEASIARWKAKDAAYPCLVER